MFPRGCSCTGSVSATHPTPWHQLISGVSQPSCLCVWGKKGLRSRELWVAIWCARGMEVVLDTLVGSAQEGRGCRCSVSAHQEAISPSLTALTSSLFVPQILFSCEPLCASSDAGIRIYAPGEDDSLLCHRAQGWWHCRAPTGAGVPPSPHCMCL